MNRSLPTAGFSLVEIVLALGIASVSLVTAIGLLGVSIESRERSGDDTVLVAMTQHVLSDLRAVPFDALWLADPRGVAAPTPSDSEPEESVFYFTREGDAVEALGTESHYECRVKKLPDAETQSANLGRYNLVKLQLEFTSPTTIPLDRRTNRRSLNASIARY